MMESGRKSAILPTGDDWRVNAAEYALKYLVWGDRERKAFIAWILNMPNAISVKDVMGISARVKKIKRARRRVMSSVEGKKARKKLARTKSERVKLKKKEEQKKKKKLKDIQASEGKLSAFHLQPRKLFSSSISPVNATEFEPATNAMSLVFICCEFIVYFYTCYIRIIPNQQIISICGRFRERRRFRSNGIGWI